MSGFCSLTKERIRIALDWIHGEFGAKYGDGSDCGPVPEKYEPDNLSANVRKVLADRPSEYEGRRPAPYMLQADWLTNVVYWSTWPHAPQVTTTADVEWRSRWLDAKACVQMRGSLGTLRIGEVTLRMRAAGEVVRLLNEALDDFADLEMQVADLQSQVEYWRGQVR